MKSIVKNFLFSLFLFSFAFTNVLVLIPTNVAYADPEPKIDICHADPVDTAANGYKLVNININALFPAHEGHSADIIPPFGTFTGQNWGTEGQAIFNNNCVVPVPPTPIPGTWSTLSCSTVPGTEATTLTSVCTPGPNQEACTGTAPTLSCPAVPLTTGTIKITKYECPSDFIPNRNDNGVGSEVPSNCSLKSGVGFEYTYDPNNETNNTGPYLGLFGDNTPFLSLALTNESGLSVNEKMESKGRYIIKETDATNLLGLYCEGDGDTNPNNNDNQEITFVPAGGITNCVAYNKTAIVEPTLCKDESANNYNQTLPCTYGTHRWCVLQTDQSYIAKAIPDNETNPAGKAWVTGMNAFCIMDACPEVVGHQSDTTSCPAPVFLRSAEITNPSNGQNVSGVVSFTATLTDKDKDDNVQWAVRKGTCAAGTGTVFGNVDGYSSNYSWDGVNFEASTDVSSWEEGLYCFVFNPTESTGDTPIRVTREFNVVKDNPEDNYQCSNGLDDDQDGEIDYPSDPGCSSGTDDDETDPAPIVCTGGQVLVEGQCVNPDPEPKTCPEGQNLGEDNECYTPDFEPAPENKRRRSSGSYIAPQGQVLGAETTCGIYVDKFLKKGLKGNDKEAVLKVQKFLNDYMKAGLDVDGIFGPKTDLALKSFQVKHKDKILNPWGLLKPTGIFYLTTQTEVNNIMCPELKLPIPALIPMEKNPLFPKV